MVYFRTVLLLVQVLGVLANSDVGPNPVEPVGSDQLESGAAQQAGQLDVLEDDYDSSIFYDYDGSSETCNANLLSLNQPLATVFASVAIGMNFKPHCLEINLAEQHYEEINIFSYATNKTHVVLAEKNVESLSDVEGIRREFESGSALKNELEQKGFVADGSEISFGCAPGKGDVVVVCYYRRQGITVKREEGLFEDEPGTKSDGIPRESESSPRQQEGVAESERDTSEQQEEA
ncbi:unnamed protein product [Cylicocyclus nassatus]|uniref:Uncharacterized protein n=1 Tax=Cylicocyclus nassatus TaxID=53992 RepID=A0AA36DM76_CYLNA|nr:unnamed protein product [Cylicocyclus nassatus]